MMEQRSFVCIQELVRCLGGFELRMVRGREAVIGDLFSHLPQGLRVPQISQELEEGLHRIRPDRVYEICGLFSLQYIILFDGEADRYLTVGPCLLQRPNLSAIRAMAREYGASAALESSILSFCSSLPLVTYDVYHQLGSILAQWLLPGHESVPHQTLDYRWDSQARRLLFQQDQFVQLAHMRQVEQRYENNAALTEAVKAGNLSLAYRFMQRMAGEEAAMIRNPDPLRNQKNLCIILNTQLRTALEDVGLHPYALDRTSREIALHIESMHSVDEAGRYMVDVIRQYCELVRDSAYPGLKPFPHLAVTYIKDHLNETLTVKDTARALLVNPDYLSDCFHREVGLTFIDFVNRERTAQAAALLRNTSLQIQQIASAVGYNNTSYFSKQFHRFHHMTPRDYRNQGGI